MKCHRTCIGVDVPPRKASKGKPRRLRAFGCLPMIRPRRTFSLVPTYLGLEGKLNTESRNIQHHKTDESGNNSESSKLTTLPLTLHLAQRPVKGSYVNFQFPRSLGCYWRRKVMRSKSQARSSRIHFASTMSGPAVPSEGCELEESIQN